MPYKVNFQKDSPYVFWTLSSVYLISLTYLFYGAKQNDFLPLVLTWLVSTSIYIYWNWGEMSKTMFRRLMYVGIIARIIGVFAFPALSDDIYRFFWDGSLSLQGINPYEFFPADVLNITDRHTQELYQLLNSPSYATIYPPIAQLFFAGAALVNNLFVFNILTKLFMLSVEGLGIYFLFKFLPKIDIHPSRILLYFLCPLVMVEGLGNLHFEVIMMSFFVVGLFYWYTERYYHCALFFAFAIGVKLLPLMLLPYFWWMTKEKSRWQLFGALGILLALFFSPLLWGNSLSNMLSSVDLYFQKFEFNASIYYLLSLIGKAISGYNIIQVLGPVLGLITIGINVRYAWLSRDKSRLAVLKYMLVAWTAYLLFATTVHPWYLIPLLMFNVFSALKYIPIWSAFISLSYVHYYLPWQPFEPWFLIIEYGIVFYFLYLELKQTNILFSTTPKLN
jgi:alpha-1,6-mannosyltransferase